MDIQESELLTKLSQSLYWKSSSGSVSVRALADSHLVNCIGYATKSMQVAQANPDISELNEYEGLTWPDWLMVFKHEYHRRAKESANPFGIAFNRAPIIKGFVEPTMVQPTNGRRASANYTEGDAQEDYYSSFG